MIRDAETHAEDDKKRKELTGLKNETSNLVYSVEKSLKENGEKISAEERRNIEIALQDTREAVKSDDNARINGAKESLLNASRKLAEAVSKNTGANQQSNTGCAAGYRPGADKENKGYNKGDVIDAEYTEEAP